MQPSKPPSLRRINKRIRTPRSQARTLVKILEAAVINVEKVEVVVDLNNLKVINLKSLDADTVILVFIQNSTAFISSLIRPLRNGVKIIIILFNIFDKKMKNASKLCLLILK